MTIVFSPQSSVKAYPLLGKMANVLVFKVKYVGEEHKILKEFSHMYNILIHIEFISILLNSKITA